MFTLRKPCSNPWPRASCLPPKTIQMLRKSRMSWGSPRCERVQTRGRASWPWFNRMSMRGRSYTVSQQARALLLPQEAKEIGTDNALIFYEGLRPIRCQKIRYYADRRFRPRLLLPPPRHATPFPRKNTAVPPHAPRPTGGERVSAGAHGRRAVDGGTLSASNNFTGDDRDAHCVRAGHRAFEFAHDRGL